MYLLEADGELAGCSEQGENIKSDTGHKLAPDVDLEAVANMT